MSLLVLNKGTFDHQKLREPCCAFFASYNRAYAVVGKYVYLGIRR